MKILISFLLLLNICEANEHWATGGWSCRPWGAIRLYELPYKFCTDVDPDGFLQDFGYWQDYDQNSIIIVWEDTSRMEIISQDKNKYYHQAAYPFGISSTIEEVSKTIK